MRRPKLAPHKNKPVTTKNKNWTELVKDCSDTCQQGFEAAVRNNVAAAGQVSEEVGSQLDEVHAGKRKASLQTAKDNAAKVMKTRNDAMRVKPTVGSAQFDEEIDGAWVDPAHE